MTVDAQLTWLNPELSNKVRAVFEPRYGRVLGDTEVYAISSNLVTLLELILKNRGARYGKN